MQGRILPVRSRLGILELHKMPTQTQLPGICKPGLQPAQHTDQARQGECGADEDGSC